MSEYAQHVLITVTCDRKHVIGTWTDTIEEKYPFYCDECDDRKCLGKYPWTLTTSIITLPVINISEVTG